MDRTILLQNILRKLLQRRSGQMDKDIFDQSWTRRNRWYILRHKLWQLRSKQYQLDMDDRDHPTFCKLQEHSCNLHCNIIRKDQRRTLRSKRY